MRQLIRYVALLCGVVCSSSLHAQDVSTKKRTAPESAHEQHEGSKNKKQKKSSVELASRIEVALTPAVANSLGIPAGKPKRLVVELDAATADDKAGARGRVVAPRSLKPFYSTNIPALSNLTIGSMMVEIKGYHSGMKRVSFDNTMLGGIMTIGAIKGYANILVEKSSDGRYDTVVRLSIPTPEAVIKDLPADLQGTLTASVIIGDAIPALKRSAIGSTVVSELTIIASTKELDARRIPGIDVSIYPGLNIVAKIEQLDVGKMVPDLNNPPLNGLVLSNATLSVQKIQNMAEIKTQLPTLAITGVADLSKATIPNINMKEARVSLKLDSMSLAASCALDAALAVDPFGNVAQPKLSIDLKFGPKGWATKPLKSNISLGGAVSVAVPEQLRAYFSEKLLTGQLDASATYKDRTVAVDLLVKLTEPKSFNFNQVPQLKKLASMLNPYGPELTDLSLHAAVDSKGKYEIDLEGAIQAAGAKLSARLSSSTQQRFGAKAAVKV